MAGFGVLQPIDNGSCPLGGSQDKSSWDLLKDAMHDRVQELKRFTQLRVDDRSKKLFEQELVGLDASVRAVEKHVAQLKAHIASENAVVPKVEALIAAAKLQAADLQNISANLPQHLPSLPGHEVLGVIRPGAAVQLRSSMSAGALAECRASSAAGAGCAETQHGTTAGGAGVGGERRKKESTTAPSVAPRAYITEAELSGVSAYMKGRLTQEKINAAVDELAGFAEANARLMAAARSNSAKLVGAERKHATELLHSVANRDGIKGRHWFLESDLKDGLVIKLDKTGKSVLSLLRHLGRLTEVRCTVEGAPAIIYVMNAA